MKKMFLVLCILGVFLLFGSHIAQAGNPPFANVSANALCTVDGTDVLVDAGLIQKNAPSSGPTVSIVVFSLEQHFPNQNDWVQIPTSTVIMNVNKTFDLLPAGERYEVSTNDYTELCSILVDQNANAVRAVVQITVVNANPKRPGGLIHTGRCVSFPNPCR